VSELKAVIPAAGYGTRLYPLTKETPKALIEVGSRPVIEYVLERIEAIGEIDTVFIVTNALYYRKFKEWLRFFDEMTALEVKIINDHTKSNEDRLGAIGDKLLAIKKGRIDDDVLDISSDNLFDFGLLNALKAFREKNGSVIGLYDVKSKYLARHYGIVAVDAEDKVVSFQEKPENPPSTLASIGIYFYQREHVPLFKEYVELGHGKDAPGYFIEWLHKRADVFGHVFKGKWFDIGSFEQLDKAREEFREAQAKK